MENPYYLNPVARLGELYGRDALLDAIVRSRENWALIGERRVGKTSILTNLDAYIQQRYQGRGRHCRAVIIDLQFAYSDDLCQWFIRTLVTKLRRPKHRRRLRKMRDTDALFHLLQDELSELQGGDRLFVCIDELDALRDIIDPRLVNFFRGLAEEPQVQLVIAAFRNPHILSEHHDAFFNIFRQKRLENLDRSSTEQVITVDGAFCPLYPDTMLDEVYDASGGNPYLTKVICYYLWQQAGSEAGSRAYTPSMLRAIYTDYNIVQMLEDHCQYAWTYLSDIERYMLLQQRPYFSLRKKGYQYGEETVGVMRWWLERNAYELETEFKNKAEQEREALRARLKAIGEYRGLLSETASISEISVVHHDGLMLKHYPELDEEMSDNTDVIISMFDAVRDFVDHSFGKEMGRLDGLDLGEYKIIVENGAYVYCVIIMARDVSADFRDHVRSVLEEVETAYHKAFESWWGLITDDLTAACDEIIDGIVQG